MKCSTVPLLLLVSFLASQKQLAEARYKLQVGVYTYSNPGNQDWDGGFCDLDRSPCDVVFLFCLRSIDSTVTSNLCPLGSHNTEGSSISAESRTFNIGGTIANSVSNPVTFTGTSAWRGSFQLMVRLTDDDHPDSDDLIDRVAVNMVLGVSDSFTPRVRYNGIYNKASMEMNFRVMCQTNYYGSACDRLCVPRDDSGGHYTCDENGNIVCLSGYTDISSLCLTPVCPGGCGQGECVAPGECSCFTGWDGNMCDQCIPASDCMNGYCLTAGDCICNDGYSGALCQIDNDVCGHQQPCQNDGTCSNNGPGDYTCNCPPGITGADCEEDVNECNSNPCENGGTCMNTHGSFTCTCAVGWTGNTCDDNIDECNSTSPCQNGATCTDCVPSGPGSITNPDNTGQMSCVLGYSCTCAEGYFGDNCETEEDYCMPSPCVNGSTCHDIIGGPGYFCECVAGFTGENCDVEIDECQPNPCQNGGNCTDNIASYTCDCAPGFTGAECHINIDDCASSPCNASNSHECVDGNNSYTCVCIPGYTGQNCDSEVDKCVTLDPCFNGATCQTLFNDFLCECPTGFTGVQCDININDCHPDLCLHGGTCMDEVNDFTCMCLPKYTGRQCENDSPTCDDKPCGKDEFCVPLVDGTFNCQPCVEGEAGCDIIGGKSPDQQTGSNGTSTDDKTRNSVIGGVVGGVVLGFLLLLLLLFLICCCFKCCLCCSRTKEQQTDAHYTSWTDNGAHDNPLYFGTSTILSSQSGTMRSSSSGATSTNYNEAYRQDSLDAKTGSLQNPMYAIAQEEIQRNAVQPPNLPPRNGSITDSGSSNGSTNTTAPLLAPPSSSSDGHYEQIPAANLTNIKAGPLVASGLYNRLKAEPSPSPEPETVVTGKYDQLTIPVQPPSENHYVVHQKQETPDDNPYTSVTRQTGRHKDMYTMLPTAEELKEAAAAADSEKKEVVKESDLPPKTQNPYDI